MIHQHPTFGSGFATLALIVIGVCVLLGITASGIEVFNPQQAATEARLGALEARRQEQALAEQASRTADAQQARRERDALIYALIERGGPVLIDACSVAIVSMAFAGAIRLVLGIILQRPPSPPPGARRP